MLEQFEEYIRKNSSADYGITPGSPRELVEASLGLAGEAGEVCDVIKKMVRANFQDNEHKKQSERREELVLELGDVFHYMIKIAQFFDIELYDIMVENINKLEVRHGRAV